MQRVFYFLAALSALVAWLVPVHFFPWVTFYSDFAAFLMLLCLALAVRRLAMSAPVQLMLGAACIPLLQWWCGVIVFAGDGVIACLYLLGFALALAVGQSIKQPEAFLDKACAILLLAALLSAWVALLQWLGGGGGLYMMDMSANARPYANFGQPNNLATLLCMGLCALLYVYERKHLGRLSSALVALLLIAGVALTLSRTPWLIFIALTIFWCWKTRHLPVRTSGWVLLGWGLIYALMVAGLPFLTEALLLPVPDFSRESGLLRLQLWWQLGHALLQGPWWGYGWNQVSMAQVAVASAYVVPLQTEYSHNIVLDLLLWNGPWIGAAWVLIGVLWLGYLAYKANTLAEICVLLALGALLTHALLELPLAYAYFLLPAGILLGLLSTQVGGPVRRYAGARVVGGVVLAAGLLMALVWREYRLIEEDHRLMRFESAGIGTLRAERSAPDVTLLSQLRDFIQYARTPAEAGMSQAKIDWMGQVAHRYPYPPSLFRYALLLALNEQLAQADQQLQVLRALHGEALYQEALQNLKSMATRYPQLLQLQSLSVD